LYRTTLRHNQFPVEELEVHEVVVRHGPEPVISRLLPKAVAADCRAGPDDVEDPTRDRLYPRSFLATPILEAQKAQVSLEYALANGRLNRPGFHRDSVYWEAASGRGCCSAS
jgi:hypothetical protein